MSKCFKVFAYNYKQKKNYSFDKTFQEKQLSCFVLFVSVMHYFSAVKRVCAVSLAFSK